MFSEEVLVREIELARRLTPWFDAVYCLKWHEIVDVDRSSAWRRRAAQCWQALRSLCALPRLSPGPDGVHYLQCSLLDPLLLRKVLGEERATVLARRYNTRMLQALLRRLEISVVLAARPVFDLVRLGNVKIFYDIVDWYPDDQLAPENRAARLNRLRAYCSFTSGVFAVSEGLAEKLRREAGVAAVALPNGADVAALRAVPDDRVAELRRRLGLCGKFVVGYVGNHGSFAGVDFLLEVMSKLRRRVPEAHLLLVGPADYWRPWLRRAPPGTVTATGPVRPLEAPLYVNASDVGVLAQRPDNGTTFAFQLKVVEFTACRKFVVAPPLDTWKRLAWPNLFLVERNPEAWAEALQQAARRRWMPEWDALAEEYEWRRIAKRLACVLQQDDASRAGPVIPGVGCYSDGA